MICNNFVQNSNDYKNKNNHKTWNMKRTICMKLLYHKYCDYWEPLIREKIKIMTYDLHLRKNGNLIFFPQMSLKYYYLSVSIGFYV